MAAGATLGGAAGAGLTGLLTGGFGRYRGPGWPQPASRPVLSTKVPI